MVAYVVKSIPTYICRDPLFDHSLCHLGKVDSTSLQGPGWPAQVREVTVVGVPLYVDSLEKSEIRGNSKESLIQLELRKQHFFLQLAGVAGGGGQGTAGAREGTLLVGHTSFCKR